MSTMKRDNGDESQNKENQMPEKDDESQLSELRLPQNFDSIIGGQKLTQYLQVKKPGKQDFIRTHHDDEMWLSAAILDFHEEREVYIVNKALCNELANEIVPKVLIPCMTAQGQPFIWPVKLPSDDGRIDEWNRSAMIAARFAQEKWVRVVSNMSINAYDTLVAAMMYPDPSWPDFGLGDWIKLGFHDRVIDSTDHPVIRKLRGEL